MATQTSFVPSSAAQGFNALAARPAPTVNFKGIDTKAKARAAAVDFEAVFLNSMFSQMFTNVDGEGPFGGDQATGVWRSFLTDEYAKSFARKGGIGIADHVYASLLAQQEIGAAR
jgi:peptidoglycan hydrolase FlgJ